MLFANFKRFGRFVGVFIGGSVLLASVPVFAQEHSMPDTTNTSLADLQGDIALDIHKLWLPLKYQHHHLKF